MKANSHAPSSIEPLEARIAPAAVAAINLSGLKGTTGFNVISGDSDVSAAGDVNGDGIGDFIISSAFSGPHAGGESYVVFGKVGGFPANLNVASLRGSTGFKITNGGDQDHTGTSVSAAGDVNGDGFDDLIIAGSGPFDAPAVKFRGQSFVIFGQAKFPAAVAVESLNGANGFSITGVANDDIAQMVSPAGDVNKDGFADLIIGAPGADEGGTDRGAAYVVFGKATGFAADLPLSSLVGTNGFKLSGVANGDHAGGSVSSADLNGDGYADVIVGASGAAEGGVARGATYVFFGKPNGFAGSVALSSLLGPTGFKLSGVADNDLSGGSVSGAGDLNGDHIDDLIIGAAKAGEGGTARGASYVFFGKTTGFVGSVALSSLVGPTGFKLSGVADGDRSGSSVHGIGDVNGDGFADVIIGAPFAHEGGDDRGAAYVVLGKASFAASVPLSTLDGSIGFKLSGTKNGSFIGGSTRGAGDVNGDGYADVIVADDETGGHVVFGFATDATSLAIGKTVKSATFTETDGDLVTVTVTKGRLKRTDFTFAKSGLGGHLQLLDLHPDAGDGRTPFAGTNVTISAKTPKGGAGNGLADVDFIDAHGVNLGTVNVSGRLEQITAGDGTLDTHGKAIVALKSLTVGSLGEAVAGSGAVVDDHSSIVGPLGALTVKHDVFSAFVDVTGATGTIGKVSITGSLDGSVGGTEAGLIEASAGIGAVTVKGSILGGATSSGVISGGKLGKVTIGGSLSSASPAKPVTISALGDLTATTAAKAVAIAGLSVKLDVLNARILAGYTTNLTPLNPDAGIGAVLVSGKWTASSLAAGVADSTADGFGRNDTLIPGDTTPTLLATIASITIKGTAIGSSTSIFTGLTAQKIGKLVVTGVVKDVSGAANVLLDPTNADFRAVDFA